MEPLRTVKGSACQSLTALSPVPSHAKLIPTTPIPTALLPILLLPRIPATSLLRRMPTRLRRRRTSVALRWLLSVTRLLLTVPLLLLTVPLLGLLAITLLRRLLAIATLLRRGLAVPLLRWITAVALLRRLLTVPASLRRAVLAGRRLRRAGRAAGFVLPVVGGVDGTEEELDKLLGQSAIESQRERVEVVHLTQRSGVRSRPLVRLNSSCSFSKSAIR